MGNAVVEPSDDVWNLGDLAVRQSAMQVMFLLNALNGRKHVVVHNNDMPLSQTAMAGTAFSSARNW